MVLASHYEIGKTIVSHKGKVTNTIVGNSVADLYISLLDNAYTYEAGFIPYYHRHRPDLIANLLMGSPAKWWLVMLINNVDDPFEGLKTGDRVLVPE